MGRRHGAGNYPLKRKAEMLVVADNETVTIAVDRYGVSRRAIEKWRSQLETDTELQGMYATVEQNYKKDLLTPAELGARAITNRIIDIARHGVKYKGELRETQEAFRALTEAVMLYRHQEKKEDLLNELKED